MNWRNPKRTPQGTIDVEIEDPVLGWIPYHATPNDRHDVLLRRGSAVPLYAVIVASGKPIAPADPPPPEPAPSLVPKLALVRAMRLTNLDGSMAAPGTEGTALTAVKAALAQAPAAVREDWEALTRVNRADPAMQMMIGVLPWPAGIDRDAVIDAAYILARKIDRGEVDPYTGQPAG